MSVPRGTTPSKTTFMFHVKHECGNVDEFCGQLFVPRGTKQENKDS
jgi:hypothetical protein